MSLKNRYAVEMRGNCPVVYDREKSRSIGMFNDVLKDESSRHRAEALAKQANVGGRIMEFNSPADMKFWLAQERQRGNHTSAR